MKKRKLGNSRLEGFALCLGCMGMSMAYGLPVITPSNPFTGLSGLIRFPERRIDSAHWEPV
jgi:hypothetical protein